ncbi:DUF6630 family protein [Paracoccus sp. J56]|nr:hypothetical protein [Paracoccus sp. J56]SMG37787.1 hypothetical protein SAMN02746000_02249 [Paracoccus sp. J56]
MPYYLKREALAPLISEVVTRTRVERLADALPNGFSAGLSGLWFTRRADAHDDYKGYYVPRSISFGRMQPDAAGFHLCLLDDVVDARFTRSGAQRSPWQGNDTPTIEEIEAYWAPLVSTDMVAEMVSHFVAVEAYAIEHGHLQTNDEDKLRMVHRYDVPLDELAAFCTILGRDTHETRSYIEDHVIFAAFNPHNYLMAQGLLAGMSGHDCRHFSWRSIVFDGFFNESRYICEVDWKADAEDVAWNVNAILAAVTPKYKQTIKLSSDGENRTADYWLLCAASQLKQLGWSIVLISNGGDSYLFTLLELSKTREFIELGQCLDLEITMLSPNDQLQPSWARRLSGLFRSR